MASPPAPPAGVAATQARGSRQAAQHGAPPRAGSMVSWRMKVAYRLAPRGGAVPQTWPAPARRQAHERARELRDVERSDRHRLRIRHALRSDRRQIGPRVQPEPGGYHAAGSTRASAPPTPCPASAARSVSRKPGRAPCARPGGRGRASPPRRSCARGWRHRHHARADAHRPAPGEVGRAGQHRILGDRTGRLPVPASAATPSAA